MRGDTKLAPVAHEAATTGLEPHQRAFRKMRSQLGVLVDKRIEHFVSPAVRVLYVEDAVQ